MDNMMNMMSQCMQFPMMYMMMNMCMNMMGSCYQQPMYQQPMQPMQQIPVQPVQPQLPAQPQQFEVVVRHDHYNYDAQGNLTSQKSGKPQRANQVQPQPQTVSN